MCHVLTAVSPEDSLNSIATYKNTHADYYLSSTFAFSVLMLLQRQHEEHLVRKKFCFKTLGMWSRWKHNVSWWGIAQSTLWATPTCLHQKAGYEEVWPVW